MPSYDLVLHRDRSIAPEEVADLSQLENDPEALLNVELERNYSSTQEPWAEAAQKSDDFLHNIQYTEEQLDVLEERRQSPVVINVIWPAIEQAIAMMTSNRPAFQATAREDSDVRTASVVSDLMSWAWQQSRGNQALKNVIYDYYVRGRGVLHVYVDPTRDFGKPEICFTDEDPLDVYPDPNSQDRLWRDAAHVLISKQMTREQIERQWPDAAEILKGAPTDFAAPFRNTSYVATDGQQSRASILDAYHEKYRVIIRYTKVKIPYNRVSELFSQDEFIFLDEQLQEYLQQPAAIVTDEQGQSQIVNGPEVQEVQAEWEQGEPTDDPRVRMVIIPPPLDESGNPVGPGQVLQVAMISNLELVQMGQIEVSRYLENRIKTVITLGGRKYYDNYLPISEYPLVPLNNRHNRTPYPMSDVQYVVPIQEQINKQQMLITANMSASTGPKLITPKGAADKDQIEEDFAKVGPGVIEYDAEFGQPVISQPVPIPNAAFTHLQFLISMVEREFGIYGLMQGDPSQAPATHKGTIAIEQFGQRRIRSKLDDVEETLNQCGIVFSEWMPYVYTERKIIRLKEPNNVTRDSEINVMQYDSIRGVLERVVDVTAGRYDIIVVSGSTLPSNRFALLEYFTGLYQMGIIDQVEVLKKTDVVDAQGVLERHNIMVQMNQQIQSLTAKVEEVQGDLQTRERELFHTKVALEVEKAKKDIGNTANRMEMAGQLYESRKADELAMQKREAKMQAVNGRAAQ